MREKLRHLLLVTLENPYDPRSWSGTPHTIRTQLEKRVERVSVLHGLKPRRNPVDALLRIALGGTPPRYPLWMTKAALKGFAEDTQAAIEKYRPDALLCISSQCLVYLPEQKFPIFMLCDAPWWAWKQAYREFDEMPLMGKRFAAREAEAARRCDGLIYASAWACAEAVRLFNVPKEKVHNHPMGARWVPQIGEAELEATIDARPKDRLDFLFIGKDWERKGGPLVLEIVRGLRERGVQNVTLHLVGCNPPLAPSDEVFVQLYGFLGTEDPQQAAKLRELFLRSHFFLVPTQAECFGLVFAEAQAHGLPPISCATQAVPSVIEDGVTGILEPKGASAEAYIERILPLIGDDRTAYRRMALAGRKQYLDTFNWDAYVEGVLDDIEAKM